MGSENKGCNRSFENNFRKTDKLPYKANISGLFLDEDLEENANCRLARYDKKCYSDRKRRGKTRSLKF